MQRSASPDNSTSQARRTTKWELPGLAKLGICSMTFGVLALAGVFIDGRDQPGIDTFAVSFLALSVTLTLGGLHAIRWGISAQKGRVREELVDEDLFSIENQQAQLMNEVREFIRVETAQSGRSKEARDRLERMERILLVISGTLKDAAVFGDRLTVIEQGMTALARAVRDATGQQSKEASAVEVRLDSLAKQLGNALAMLGKLSLEMPAKDELVAEVREQLLPDLVAEVKAAVKAERVAGYLDDVRGRLGNGAAPDLRVVRPAGEE